MERRILNTIKKGEVTAIIPARSGSKGIHNKNIKCLNGYPILAYSIAIAKLCPSISRVIVSTDSEQYAEVARYYGAEIPFMRPKEISGDQATDLEFMQHAIQWMFLHENATPEFFVHLRPTTPLREVELVNKAVERLKVTPWATSLRSSHLTYHTPYKWFNIQENGCYKCMIEKMSLDEANNPRQSFPDVYIPNGYVDVLRTSHIVEHDLMHGEQVLAYVVPEGVDIDTKEEFEYLENLMVSQNCPIQLYLEQNYKKLKEIENC